ncbi:hypothetical protein ABBQ32_002796 [Trebouxia sp. C0010 RCD-2024]
MPLAWACALAPKCCWNQRHLGQHHSNCSARTLRVAGRQTSKLQHGKAESITKAHRRQRNRHRRCFPHVFAAMPSLQSLPWPGDMHVSVPSITQTWSSMHSMMTGEVVAATSSASFKLIFICVAVGWLLKTSRLPKETAPVLTQVAYTALIPCMLFTKCAATLASNRSLVLIGLPLAAILQVLTGSALGWLAAQTFPEPTKPKKEYYGWHPNNPAKSASAIAGTTAAATGVPQAAAALMPTPSNPPEGTRQMVMSCCAFGNSLTLPLVFLLALLPGGAADRATGYLALFMMGWSPMLWSFGLQLLGRSMPASQPGLQTRKARSAAAANMRGVKGALVTAQATARRQWSRLKRSVGSVINPPLFGVISGVIVGLSPAGPLLFLAPSAASSSMPFELKIVVGALRAIVDILQTLGGATLAVTTVVLGASMFPQNKSSDTVDKQATSGTPQSIAGADGRMKSLQWLRAILPRDHVERRVLGTVGFVRLILMPMASMAIVGTLAALGLLPDDPICRLVLLVEGSMPTAQNLVLLMNLNPNTQPLASKTGKLLLRLYPIAILPVTVWMTLFVQWMPVALAAL